MSTRPCDGSIAAGRFDKAVQFMRAAEDVGDLADDQGEVRDAVVTLLVHAGIAAADVICCKQLGEYSMGSDNHSEAVNLLKKVRTPNGSELASSLARLLRVKTKAGYAYRPASSEDHSRAMRAAEKLVQAARDLA